MVLLMLPFQIITQHCLQYTMTAPIDLPNGTKHLFFPTVKKLWIVQDKHSRQSALRYRRIVIQIVRRSRYFNNLAITAHQTAYRRMFPVQFRQ